MPRSAAVLLVLLVAGVTAAGTAARSGAVKVVQRGQTVRVSVSPPGTEACIFSLTYFNQPTKNWPPKNAELGKVSWSVKVPKNAPLGPANWSVRCLTWTRGGTWKVVAAPTPAPAVTVLKSGYSQASNAPAAGSLVSYGAMLDNTSSTTDAKNVSLLAGFVDAQGRLIGSVSRTVALIPAGSTYAFGDSAALSTQRAVKKLEVSVHVGAGASKSSHPGLQFTNVHAVVGPLGSVSEVDGEIGNPGTQTLTSAQLSLVVLDTAGAIVGGGSLSFATPVPGGARALFAAKAGFAPIPAGKAGSVIVSAQPTFG
jgi:hypothetical protein